MNFASAGPVKASRDSGVHSSFRVLVGLALVLVPIAFMGANTGLALYAVAVLLLGVGLLWRPGEPAILLLIFAYQWLQAGLAPFYGNLTGQKVGDWATNGGQQELAVVLSLSGLGVLALAIRLAIGASAPGFAARMRDSMAIYPLTSWAVVYAAAVVISMVASVLASASQGLYQIFLFLTQLKFAAFYLLTYASFAIPGRSKFYWFAAFAFEFASGIGGFFSSFSSVFFYTLIALLASNVRFRLHTILPLAVIGCAMVFVGVVWTAVKPEYRAYVNGGTGEQIVTIGYADRMSELNRLVGDLDAAALSDAQDQMAQRTMYTEFFGVVLDYVPAFQPHSDGAIWGQAIISPFMPRLFFPDKAIINDTELTSRYTGQYHASWDSGVSISLGYMAEAYIDFGPLFMFVAIAGLGLFIGRIYRWLLNLAGQHLIVGVAMAPVVLMPAHLLEASSLKMIPPLILGMIESWMILRWLGPQLFKYLDGARNRQRSPQSAFAR